MDKYEESCKKWKELVKKIFGTENITWRLDPESGQIFFSTKGVEQIKATVVFLAMTRNYQDRIKWTWAWAGKNAYLRRIPEDNRIMPADITEYLEDGGTFEEPNLFKPECLNLAITKKGLYYLKYMRAKIMEMLGGQFIFEGDINGSNAIFVILKAKKIKQVAPQEPELETPESPEPDETSQTPQTTQTQKTPENQKTSKKLSENDSDEE